MKELKIEFTEEQAEGYALTPKKAYDVYAVDTTEGSFLIADNNRDFLWVDDDDCKQAF
jgi:hypothetical protein